MSQFSYDCPHTSCGTRKSAFRITGMNRVDDTAADITASCQSCHRSVVFALAANLDMFRSSADQLAEALRRGSKMVTETFPKAANFEHIEHVPERVHSAYLEAEANRRDGRLLSAAVGYRTALERMLKLLAPSTKKERLYDRIERLAGNGTIPDALTGLMHEVRFLGNDIHEIEDPNLQDVNAGADFTQLLLTYVYELPKRVELAAERRAAAKAETED